MFLHDLFEAPVGNFDVIGDMDGSGSFRHQSDIKALNSEKAVAKVRRILAKVPQTLDLVFIDDPSWEVTDDILPHLEKYAGVYSQKKAEQIIGRTLPQKSNPKSITIVYTNNEGNQRIPMTPWIIAHRIGHALSFSEQFQPLLENIVYNIRDITSFMYDGWGIPRKTTVCSIGTMRSARQGELTSVIEFPIECFSQFVVTGSVKFNHLTIAITDANPHKIDHDHLIEVNGMIDYCERYLNKKFAEIMSLLEGQVVIL